MARAWSVAKAGFYPAHEVAIEGILKHLYLKGLDPTKKYDSANIIDPCCGKGAAIKQIADALGVANKNVYTVELDGGRSKDVKELMPDHNHLGPASFRGASISGCSFGLAYVNPPFDSELGGGRREEMMFAMDATRLLVTGGVLVLVCPINAVAGNRQFVEFLDSHYRDIAAYRFPDAHRNFREIAIIGYKRSTPVPGDKLDEGTLHKMSFHWGYVRPENLPALGSPQPARWHNGSPSYERETDIRTWEIPLSWKPTTFKKTKFTDAEIVEALARSPLNRHLKEVVIPPPEAPPMPLSKGHLGLILASGFLDGVVNGPHGTHVVRGSSHKVEYHNEALDEDREDPETGAVTSKRTYSQRMVTVIRCVEQDGAIRTFSNDSSEKEGAADMESEKKHTYGRKAG